MGSTNTAIFNKIELLNDLDVTVLASLISQQHRIFSSVGLDSGVLRRELQRICTQTFGLQVACVDCTADTTIDEFNEGLLGGHHDSMEQVQDHQHGLNARSSDDENAQHRYRPSPLSGFHDASEQSNLDERRVADVIIAHNLDFAVPEVQVQAVELIRTKRIFTRTAMHTAPKQMLFLAITSDPGATLSHHLNDLFATSHVHHEETTGFKSNGKIMEVPLSHEEVEILRDLCQSVHTTPEMMAFLHHIVVFMRMSRFVAGGVTPAATRHLRSSSQALAVLQGLDFVTPDVVMQATREVYLHRIVLATAKTERSLQWGSDPDALKPLFDGVTVADVIQDVLASIEPPL